MQTADLSNSNLFRCRVLSCGGIIWWIFPSRLQTLSKLHFQTHIKCNPTLFNHLRQGIRASVSYAIFRIHTRVILFESILMAKAEIVNPFTLSHNQSTHTHYTIEKKNLFFLCKHAVRLFNCRCIVIYIVFDFFFSSFSLSFLSVNAAPQQLTRILLGAAKAWKFPFVCWNHRLIRKHSGNIHVPTSISAKSGGSARIGTRFP